jgi:hypothetical protein
MPLTKRSVNWMRPDCAAAVANPLGPIVSSVLGPTNVVVTGFGRLERSAGPPLTILELVTWITAAVLISIAFRRTSID